MTTEEKERFLEKYEDGDDVTVKRKDIVMHHSHVYDFKVTEQGIEFRYHNILPAIDIRLRWDKIWGLILVKTYNFGKQ